MTTDEKMAFILPKDYSAQTSGGIVSVTSDLSKEYMFSEMAFDELHYNSSAYSIECYIAIAAETVKAEREGLRAYWIAQGETKDISKFKRIKLLNIDNYKTHKIVHSQKTGALLITLSRKVKTHPFESVKLILQDLRETEILNEDEAATWIDVLMSNNYIESDEYQIQRKAALQTMARFPRLVSPLNYPFKLTPKAWKNIEDQSKGINSNKVFIAMSFGLSDRHEVAQAITSACDKQGFKASTVDQEHYLGKITDKIYAMIKESAFIVADYCGNNHGVYFESGYAEGLGKKVIYTVRAGKDLDELHFDTKQTNYIVYSTYEELTEKVSDRIRASIL